MNVLKVLVLIPVFAFSQNYFEAFGQTKSFTLAAGASAGWDDAIAVEKAKMAVAGMAMTVYPNPSNGSLDIRVQNAVGRAMVDIYNIAGKKIEHLILVDGKGAKPAKTLPNGFYFAKLYANGRMIQITRFLVVR